MSEVTYEAIRKANETIRTTTLKRENKKTGEVTSKEYAEVNQRIKAFRMVYPIGLIHTHMLSNENGICIFRAEVYTGGENSRLLATGTAFEKESSSFINQTSYIENCETSAVGRALGMAGFGIDTSVASAEEVQNAIANQDKKAAKPTEDVASRATQQTGPKATPNQVAILKKIYTGKNMKKLLEANGIEKIEDMTLQKASDLIKKLEEKQKGNETK